MNYRQIIYLLILLSFLACSTKLRNTESDLEKEIFSALHTLIQDSLWNKMVIGDTLFVNPIMKIHPTSCSTYGYTNFIIEQCIKDEISFDKWKDFDEIARNLDSEHHWNVEDYLECKLPVIFENRKFEALNFSPILRIDKDQYQIFAFINSGNDEFAYYFKFKRINDAFKGSLYFSIDECFYYRTRNDYLSNYWYVKDTLKNSKYYNFN